MQFPAPYVLYSSLKAPGDGMLEPHVQAYRKLLEAIRDDAYDFDAAEKMGIVDFKSLPVIKEV